VRLPFPFYSAGDHIAIDLPGSRAMFTTRRGGYSSGPFESLNLGIHTDDDPELVAANHDALAAVLGVEFAYARQVHGAHVLSVDAGTPRDRSVLEADGILTATPGVAPLVRAADCLEIAVGGSGAVAMLHAGWRGLAGGVIAAGVQALRVMAGAGPLAAAIGPGAGVCCYEVGEEVHAAFAKDWPEARRGSNLDLKLIARRQLEAAGVAWTDDVDICTICSDPALFYSHRRDAGVTGRHAGIAWLT
jgi:YfiH family protein